MSILIKLLPPFKKPGTRGEFTVNLSAVITSPADLASFIADSLAEELAYPVFDNRGNLNADFLLNGSPLLNSDHIDDGSHIMVIPLICGG